MNCPECGAPLRPDAAFCGNCGTRLEQGRGNTAAYGNVFTKTLAPGEAIDIEPGAFLWKDASMTMDTNVTNLSTGLFGGTSFTLNRFSGPGRLGIQSMTYHAPINANEGHRSTGINLGGLLNT